MFIAYILIYIAYMDRYIGTKALIIPALQPAQVTIYFTYCTAIHLTDRSGTGKHILAFKELLSLAHILAYRPLDCPWVAIT